jgi:hypothetical protein
MTLSAPLPGAADWLAPAAEADDDERTEDEMREAEPDDDADDARAADEADAAAEVMAEPTTLVVWAATDETAASVEATASADEASVGATYWSWPVGEGRASGSVGAV